MPSYQSNDAQDPRSVRSIRLAQGDRDLARQLFAAMADVFDTPAEPLSDAYIDKLLVRDDFWAIAAFVGFRIPLRPARRVPPRRGAPPPPAPPAEAWPASQAGPVPPEQRPGD